MKPNFLRALAASAIGLSLYLVEAPGGVSPLSDAHAIVGAPATPVSVADVARRTTGGSLPSRLRQLQRPQRP